MKQDELVAENVCIIYRKNVLKYTERQIKCKKDDLVVVKGRTVCCCSVGDGGELRLYYCFVDWGALWCKGCWF